MNSKIAGIIAMSFVVAVVVGALAFVFWIVNKEFTCAPVPVGERMYRFTCHSGEDAAQAVRAFEKANNVHVEYIIPHGRSSIIVSVKP